MAQGCLKEAELLGVSELDLDWYRRRIEQGMTDSALFGILGRFRLEGDRARKARTALEARNRKALKPLQSRNDRVRRDWSRAVRAVRLEEGR